MKLDIILVDLAIVALVVVPYVLFVVMSSSESKKLKKKFQEESSRHLGKIDELNSWNQIITGLDKSLRKLVLVQRIEDDFRIEVTDLKNVGTCELKTEYANVVINKVRCNILTRIDIEFTDISGVKFYLNLYDNNISHRQDFELKNAQKLLFSVKGCLSYQPPINSAA